MVIKERSKDLLDRLKKIRLVATDFDGVLTDNTVLHFSDGTEAVMRSRADSLAIDLLFDAGLYDKVNYQRKNHKVDIVILSRESNPVVKSVADKIKVKCSGSLYYKLKTFEEEVKERGLDFSEVLFIGNDLNDLDCIKRAGIGVAVADSNLEVLSAADYVTQNKGGYGAFREVCDLIIKYHSINKS